MIFSHILSYFVSDRIRTYFGYRRTLNTNVRRIRKYVRILSGLSTEFRTAVRIRTYVGYRRTLNTNVHRIRTYVRILYGLSTEFRTAIRIRTYVGYGRTFDTDVRRIRTYFRILSGLSTELRTYVRIRTYVGYGRHPDSVRTLDRILDDRPDSVRTLDKITNVRRIRILVFRSLSIPLTAILLTELFSVKGIDKLLNTRMLVNTMCGIHLDW